MLKYDGMLYDQNVELFISLLAFKILFFGFWVPLQLSCFLAVEETMNNSCLFYTNVVTWKKILSTSLCFLYRNEKTAIQFVLYYFFFLITESYLEIFRHRFLRKKYVPIVASKHCHFYLREVFGKTLIKYLEIGTKISK